MKLLDILLKIFQQNTNSNELKQGKVITEFEKKLVKFQKIINYNFKNIELLKTALIHDSCYRGGGHFLQNNGKMEGNSSYSVFERMEFFGVSVLGLVVCEHLYKIFPNQTEGFLSKMKSDIVSEKYLALKAQNFQLQDFIALSDVEVKNGGRERKSIIADTVEALICAIYLDSGLANARVFIKSFILTGFQKTLLIEDMINYKSILQEYCQAKYQKTPFYHLVSSYGPDHHKVFKMIVYLNDKKCGIGEGPNKKDAQQKAAQNACKELGLK